jgi:hypothetical protein
MAAGKVESIADLLRELNHLNEATVEHEVAAQQPHVRRSTARAVADLARRRRRLSPARAGWLKASSRWAAIASRETSRNEADDHRPRTLFEESKHLPGSG